ncbi:Ff.00g009460.m01.CDS01 [Fusarium sp. VM40]|nr:Ff.00g009460.m01.CDS01 [Fusarium sp. VM40]
MPTAKPTRTVFYGRDKALPEDSVGPRESIENEEPFVKVVSDIQDFDDYESFDEDLRSVTPENAEEKTAREKRPVSHDEESSEEDSKAKVKPSPKRQRRSAAEESVMPRRSKRVASAAPSVKDEASPTKTAVKRGPGRPPAGIQRKGEEVMNSKRGRGRPTTKRQVTSPDSDTEWEVEEIVESRIDTTTKKQVYLVKWKGYSSKHNTWEPRKNLGNCLKLVRKFEERQMA